jgi:hypothetical protein
VSDPGVFDHSEVAVAVDRLVDEYRTRCLWYLREGYYPTNDEQRIQALEAIARHGDCDAFRRAGELRQWLLLASSAESAGS